MKRFAWMSVGLLVLAGAAWGCASERAAETETAAAPAAEAQEPTITAEEAVQVTEEGTMVTIYVTKEGFVPAAVHVPAGKPVTLQVTRKTERTCATELVMAEHEINQKLPLNEMVEITFTPEEAGELRYACGMDMIAGTIVVD